MADRAGSVRRHWLVRGVALLAVGGAVALVALSRLRDGAPQPRPDPPTETESFPLTPVAASPYLNTGPAAHYLGSQACRPCHPAAHDSFHATDMGRSMADAVPGREPPDATFDHPASQRRYQVFRKDGQVWHRELLLTGGPEEVVLCEYPLKYVVGSGRHSRTYAAEADGFLVESPLTWYASRQAWRMSPGYDDARQPGFQRGVGANCLACHAGQSEAVEGSWHRIHVTEAAVGCERCHGPGSLHVERHTPRPGVPPPAPEGIDHTIVNPANLTRELAEAVCQQCHLRPAALVPARGRKPEDFRPGLPLEDFLHAYSLDAADAAMSVVGHVEQMHLSRCYQASGTLTCVTCHDAHAEPRKEERASYYNAACLGCHRRDACKVSPALRAHDSPGNDCVQCHMPTAPTDIPHLAFTHHRIGVHDRTGPAPAGGGTLRPFGDLSRLSAIDRGRSLGLAYFEAADRARDAGSRARYQERALGLLSDARAEGLRDGLVDASLARLHHESRLGDALSFAESALAHPDLAPQDRCNALYILAEGRAREGRHAEAITVLRQLTRLRRFPVDWLLLADEEGAVGNGTGSVAALETATRIDPRLWKTHQKLADYYQRQGDEKRAAWHRQRAVP
jgi:hypothetical protein